MVSPRLTIRRVADPIPGVAVVEMAYHTPTLSYDSMPPKLGPALRCKTNP